MPFPNDEELMKTAAGLVAQLQALFGAHPGKRPAHAKGVLLSGSFVPSAKAGELSIAPHFNAPSTPILVRFSNSTGIPNIPDTDPNADPRGIAIRFNLPSVDGKRKHTDVIAHSTPTFPVRTGELFLEMLKAIGTSPPDAPHPSPIEQFIGAHPSALVHVQWPNPPPVSYGTEQFWSVTAFKLVDSAGKETFIRYHVVPTAGISTLSTEEVGTRDSEYLQTELKERIAAGPIGFKLLAQIALEGDVTDDATVHWAQTNPVVELGELKIDSILPEQDKEQKYVIFDPIPRIEGVDASADPLLEMRAALYLISGKQRRAA